MGRSCCSPIIRIKNPTPHGRPHKVTCADAKSVRTHGHKNDDHHTCAISVSLHPVRQGSLAIQKRYPDTLPPALPPHNFHASSKDSAGASPAHPPSRTTAKHQSVPKAHKSPINRSAFVTSSNDKRFHSLRSREQTPQSSGISFLPSSNEASIFSPLPIPGYNGFSTYLP